MSPVLSYSVIVIIPFVLKVIPPKEWIPRKHYGMDVIGEMVIDAPIAQLVTGGQGRFENQF